MDLAYLTKTEREFLEQTNTDIDRIERLYRRMVETSQTAPPENIEVNLNFIFTNHKNITRTKTTKTTNDEQPQLQA